MDNNNITPDTQPDANQLGAAGGQGAVGGQNPQEPVLTLSELNTFLGKNFKDKDTAFKSLKDTQSYVGKVGQYEKELATYRQNPAAVTNNQGLDEVRNEVSSMRNELWFEKNPQYKSMRPLVEKLAKADGKGLHEIVELPEFKDTFSKVQGFDKSQGLRTVLESNPRLASSQDKMQKAQNLAGTRSRKSLAEAGDLAIQAVMDATPDL